MRAFASFLVMLILVGAIGYAGLMFVRQNADKFKKGTLQEKIGHQLAPAPPPGPPVHGPEDYHILQDQGGVPKTEADKAGLVTAQWAYLSALPPVQETDGIETTSGAAVRSRHYDECYRFGPGTGDEQYLEFTLAAKWDELHFGFGFSDSEPSDPTNSHAIELTVMADGKPVLGPQRLTPVDPPLFTQLDVHGVNRVVFVCKRIGMGNAFAPVLLDPFVRLSAPPPPAAPTTQTPPAATPGS